jgi:hypothetical protein
MSRERRTWQIVVDVAYLLEDDSVEIETITATVDAETAQMALKGLTVTSTNVHAVKRILVEEV